MPAPHPEPAPDSTAGGRQRALRSDAKRNRQRVIDTAFDVFSTQGLSVPVHEIARRAGVGTGTVSRHFPTKESLFEAVFRSRVERLSGVAHELLDATEQEDAFFKFFAQIVAEGTANLGLAQALAGAGCELGALTSGDNDIMALMGQLLAAAQARGTVRADATVDDAKALLTACLQRDPTAQQRMLAIVRAGLGDVHPRHPASSPSDSEQLTESG